ncbi:MAG: arylsulfatase [Planctomycetota bacterium]
MPRHLLLILLVVIQSPLTAEAQERAERPNVILIMVDDQGYGDIAAHGNPVLQTPHLDKLHGESVRLTDYHTDPTCSPTRAALLTGRYSTRTGVWHTINGRSLLHPDEYTMAEYFRDNGYRTGMFGKWHLGANAPFRPMDQGFDHCVWSPSGAVNQGANWLGNDCFDDTYKLNDQWQQFPGYHTDVWFEQAMKFIADTDTHGDEPFFVYLPTTAVHVPWNIDDRYAQPYRDAGLPEAVAKFYGMVSNVDENLGKLRAFLEETGLSENTILIYTTDNGTAIGTAASRADYDFFNAGMRAWKGSSYEGGHRVPFFVHWPAGGLDEGREVDRLTMHLDVLPTLVDLTAGDIQAEKRMRGPMDGESQLVFWMGVNDLPAPPIRFVHVQRQHIPPKWDHSSVMTERWRLVNGHELYDIEADPGQEQNVAAKHPEIVERLRSDYEKWWASLEPVFDDVARFDLGGAENPTTLMSHDWLVETGQSVWNHHSVRHNDLRNGPFAVNVVQAGRYRITPMRWPEYVDRPSGCTAGMVQIDFQDHLALQKPMMQIVKYDIDPAKPTPDFEIDLPSGLARLTTTLTREDGETFGAYYVKIEYIGDSNTNE